MKRKLNAIQNALNGIIWGLRTQSNYKIHTALSIITIVFGLFFEVSYTEWLILITMMVLGFTIETINTAIEQLGDAITSSQNEHIGLAKDSGAGAMLLFSLGAMIIAAWIFVPKLLEVL